MKAHAPKLDSLRQIHSWLYDLLGNRSTQYRSSGVCATRCTDIASIQRHKTTTYGFNDTMPEAGVYETL